MINHRFTASVAVAGCLTLLTGMAVSPEENSSQRKKETAEKLKPFNALIGSWNGVGQLRRGSTKGAWKEKTQCEWNFDGNEASVVLKSEGGKQFQELRLKWDGSEEQLVLQQKSDGKTREYRGTLPKKWPERLQLVSKPEANGASLRCTIQQLSDNRSTLLFEKRSTPTGSFRRVAGIGYQRSGTRLATVGGNQRKCVVTGGLGTIPVSYKGKTYYVCCQGCVQAFNDSPDEIIAEYRASLKKE